MSKKWTWDLLEQTVSIKGVKKVYTEEECHWAAKENGLTAFPPSYIECMKRFGLGDWDPDFFIGVPGGELRTASISYCIATGREIFNTLVKGGVKIKQRELWERLLVFGRNGCGFSLCWDPAGMTKMGEMPLVMIEREYLEAVYVGESLLEFLGDYWVDGKIEKVCPHRGWAWDSKPNFMAG
jgi:hypothetical protein